MEITSILTIIVGILFFVIMILGIIYIKMSVNEKNGKPIKENKNSKVKQSKSNISAQYNKQSIFSFMEFDKIQDNMIVQKNGKRFLMVVGCQGINYDLMSKIEKISVEEGFSQFLNTLRHPIQIYTQTRTINLDESLQNYKDRLETIKSELDKKEFTYRQMMQSGNYSNKQLDNQKIAVAKEKNLYEYGKDIIFNTERMSLNKNVLRKQYFIVIPYYAETTDDELFGKEEIENTAFSELYTKAQSIIRTLSACSVSGKILDSYELVDLLYNAYNRDESEIYGIKKAQQAGYDELYVTAPDVLDKKIVALDEEIESRAMQKAREIVSQVQSEKQKKLEEKEFTMDAMIDDLVMQILQDNEAYIGADVKEEAEKKVRKTKEKGGEENGSIKETRTTRQRARKAQ